MNYDVKIHKVYDTDKPEKALASVTLDGKIVIHGIRVIETGKERFLSMPHTMSKGKDGKTIRWDMAHPISLEARKELECAVFAAYETAKNQEKEKEGISK